MDVTTAAEIAGILEKYRGELLRREVPHGIDHIQEALQKASMVARCTSAIDRLKAYATGATAHLKELGLDAVALDDELGRARRKFPGNRHLLAALMEEVGELAQAFLQRQGKPHIQKESLQVACVAMRIFAEGDPEFDTITDDEAKA